MKSLLVTVLAATSLFTGLCRGESPIYELRIYRTHEGKLPDLLTRFRDHTCRLFEKHGFTNVGYWTPVDEESGKDTTLYFLLSHKDRETSTASWQAFLADPEWQAAARASEANGKILAQDPESIFLKLTDFSESIQNPGEPGARIFELRTYTTVEGKLENLHARFRNHTGALFAKHGMQNLMYFNPIDAEKGANNTLIYFLAHQSKEAGLESFTAFRSDPAWIEAKAASETNGSLTVPDGVKSVFLAPTDFSKLK
jgi:hypothetical protein